MIEPIGISHYGICVRDLDRSLAFYRDILGMQCGPIREQNMAEHFGDRQAQVYQKPRKSRRAARLTWGDESSAPWLVLSSHDDTSVEGEAPKLDQVGIHHICFSVKDPVALAHHLMENGVQLAGSLESYARASDGKVHAFYVLTPMEFWCSLTTARQPGRQSFQLSRNVQAGGLPASPDSLSRDRQPGEPRNMRKGCNSKGPVTF